MNDAENRYKIEPYFAATTINSWKSFGFFLVDLSRLFRKNFDKAIYHAGLKVASGEERTLVHIADVGHCNQARLSSRMGTGPMTVSKYIDRLALGDFVSRSPDQLDQRSKIIILTSNGKSLLHRIEPIINAVYRGAVEGIYEDETLNIHSKLQIMRVNLLNNSEKTII